MNGKLWDPGVAFLRTLNASHSRIERTGIVLIDLSCIGIRRVQRWERYAYFCLWLAQLLVETRTAWDEFRLGYIGWKSMI